MKHKNWFLIISAVILVPGLISLLAWGLKLSIDFTGGSVITYKMGREIDGEQLKTTLNEKNAEVQLISHNSDFVYTIRTKPINPENIDPIKQAISEKFEGAELTSFETVGPVIGQETARNAVRSITWASVGILLYIAYAFRNIPKPHSSFRFGMVAIIAMLHDALVVLGVFSILGHFMNIEIDSLFITAMLTIIGFSVHDTIVVFDRIRENLRKLPKYLSFEEVVNFSLVETMNRSIATSLTVLMTLLSLYVLGGASIKNFVLAMLIGIFSGTYSSIFTASPLIIIWEKYAERKRNKAKK